jgi:hypothetical protein
MIRQFGGNWEFGEYGLQVNIRGAKVNVLGKIVKLINNGEEDAVYVLLLSVEKHIREGQI